MSTKTIFDENRMLHKRKRKDVKDTKRDKKRVRESDEWTSKNLNCTDYSINNVMKRDDSWGVKRDDSCWWWRFCNLSEQRLRGVATLVNWKKRLNKWRRSFISNKILSIRLNIKKKYHRWMLIFFSYKKGDISRLKKRFAIIYRSFTWQLKCNTKFFVFMFLLHRF